MNYMYRLEALNDFFKLAWGLSETTVIKKKSRIAFKDIFVMLQIRNLWQKMAEIDLEISLFREGLNFAKLRICEDSRKLNPREHF